MINISGKCVLCITADYSEDLSIYQSITLTVEKLYASQ